MTNHLLDFFTQAPLARNDPGRVAKLFSKAYSASGTDAIAAAFHLRDVRGGYGERESFRVILRFMADFVPTGRFVKLIPLIPEYGRWDDLLILGKHRYAGSYIVTHVKNQYNKDLASDTPSLLGKYLFSENASSEITKTFADFWMRTLILHGSGTQDRSILNSARRTYRKSLSLLRSKLNIVERHMSNARFDLIDYATVPASAMHIYRHAFARRDGERYYKYLHSLEKPVLGEIEQAPDITEEVMMEILSSERLAPIYKALGVKK